MLQQKPFIRQMFLNGFASSVILTFLAMMGCDDGRPKRVPVSGRVTIDGKPLSVGYVVTYPEKGRMASGEIGPDGRFSLSTFEKNDGCILGKHKVTVTSSRASNPTTLEWFAPKKYGEQETSGLEIDVPGPRDDLEIKLTWAGNEPDHPYTEKIYGEPPPRGRRGFSAKQAK